MSLSVDEAIELIKDSSKYQHSLFVSRIMKVLAIYFDKPEQDWILVGLLHDLDYDMVDDFSQHGLITSKQLENRISKETLYAIQAHDHRTGVKPESLLDEAIIFADSLSGFLETKAVLEKTQLKLKEQPWLRKHLINFADKYKINVLEIIEQLVI